MDYIPTNAGVLMPVQPLQVGGVFHGQIIRDDKIIEEFEDHNLVVNEGLNALNNIMFDAGTQITAWYLGIFEANYTPVSTVTAATIASASTESTAYTLGTRPAYTPAASSSQIITNSASPASFTFNATKTIYGGFLISSSTKGGTSGTLFAAAAFATSKSVVSGDQLLLTYQFTSSSV